jgi:FixJ family two-component response regulator
MTAMQIPDPRVFIIDDDPSARRGLTRLVRAAGMHAESFASAKDFLESEPGDGPSCIVLDVKMPGMTGPELQEELTKTEYSIPIVFITAHGDVPTTAQAMKKGAVDFLTKPVDRDDLLAAIRVALARDAENRAELAQARSIRERIKTLTPREYEVMTFVITVCR